MRFNRKISVILIIILLSTVSLEYYAHNWTQVDILPVISYGDALNILHSAVNDTYIFSSNGAKWLFALVWNRLNTSYSGYAFIYVFKIQENENGLNLRTDIKPIGISASSPSNPNFYTMVQIQQVELEKNYMAIMISYLFFTIGSTQVNLELEINVFQESYIMLSNVGQATINLETSVTYP